jgi:hypothetical protein
MIHIATVHFNSGRWIEIQRRYLDRFIGEEFRVYGSLEGVPQEFERFFDVVVPSHGPHAGKLNLLGRVVLAQAHPDDLIFFLDGDAFPIADLTGVVREHLRDAAVAAICRLENGGDRQPHPCFCAVRAATWSELPGDWSEGHPIRESVTDVGANLLFQLESKGLEWSRILRSNRCELHPVLFGIYGDLIYHHGAGFRAIPLTRQDGSAASSSSRLRWRRRKAPTTGEVGPHFKSFLEQRGLTEDHVDDIVKAASRNATLSKQVFSRIQADPDFYRQFL